MATKLAYLRDGGPVRVTPALRARVRELEAQALGMLKRRRPLREPWERAFGPALEVRIVIDRTRSGWVATVPRMRVECVADAYTDAISRAALAVLRMVADGMMGRKGGKPPCSVTFAVVRAKPRFIRYAVDPRTPEQRAIDEEVYELCEAGKFFRDFKPPKPPKRKRAKRKCTGARR